MSYTDYTIQITVDGTVYPISRDVTHAHPDEVHTALETDGDESALQRYLDQAYVGDWYDDETGNHMGPDPQGLELFWLDDDGKPILRLPDEEDA